MKCSVAAYKFTFFFFQEPKNSLRVSCNRAVYFTEAYNLSFSHISGIHKHHTLFSQTNFVSIAQFAHDNLFRFQRITSGTA
jgi:hypothetical protein